MIAQNITENKIMILSGSNSLYGINSEMIQNQTGIKTVNFATSATLRDYIFERAKRVLKSQDIVIMPLEYTYYFGTQEKVAFMTQSLKYQYIIRRDENYYKNQSLIYKINGRLIGLKDLLFNMKYYGQIPNVGYHLQFMNQYGDFIANNYTQDFTPIVIGFPDNFPILFSNNIFRPYENKEVTDFIKWTKDNNVTLIATYPSILCYDFYYYEPYVSSFKAVEEYYKKYDLDVIGTPYDFCYYDINLFYNTDYHLNDKGRTIRTQFMIDELKKILDN
ncbi:MAG: hypothetical protein PHT94_04230 [Candidatus Nanoarchaeia archaeon]|nr:hypothetical protein [Candidatus Nanoarchaeia archaeon]